MPVHDLAPTAQPRRTAVVIGAGMAGLLSAAALAPRVDRVVVLDRDHLPAGAQARGGTPQCTHSHGVLASGSAAMEALLPGLRAELVARGAFSEGDLGTTSRWWVGGGLIADCAVGRPGMAVSRVLLESAVRDRVRALDAVTVRDEVDVAGLHPGPDGGVAGVRVLDRADGAAAETIAADLVVDASGRTGRTETWLRAGGWPSPEVETVDVGVRYVTTHVAAREDDLDGRRASICAATPEVPRAGVAIRQEGGTWTITLVGYADSRPPLDADGVRAFARTLASPDLTALLDGREPLARPRAFRFPSCRRRRFDQRPGMPRGYVAIGDTVCSFDPAFGQGMSVAALEATALAEEIDRGGAGIEERLHRRCAAIVDGPWRIVVGADLLIPGVRGEAPPGHAMISTYLRRVQLAARRDPVVAAAFLRVVNLLAPPPSLMAPAIAWRVLRGGIREPAPAGV